MESQDKEFFLKLFEVFKEESAEHLKSLQDNLLLLEKENKVELIESIHRDFHSLKGSARAVGIDAIVDICQLVEDAFSLLKKDARFVEKIPFEKIHKILEGITAYLADCNPVNGSSMDVTLFRSLAEEVKMITSDSIKGLG
jgi:two-component system, chemotaxis family, sensor kinase CheA